MEKCSTSFYLSLYKIGKDMTEKLGIIDIGSNSVILTVAVIENKKAKQLKEFFRVTKLGEGLTSSGNLSQQAMLRTINALKQFVDEGRSLGIKIFVATATSAVRDAQNGEYFLELVKHEIGITPKLLSGKKEADLIFHGTTADLIPGELVITADPGGGSTEINIGYVGEDPFYSHSFQVGCVRQADMFDLYEVVLPKQIELARNSIHSILAPAFKQNINRAKLLISGGTATTYSAMVQSLELYNSSAVHHHASTSEELDYWIEKLFSMSSKERGQIQGLDSSRAPMLPTGMLIMSEILKGFNINEFLVTTTALRHGILLEIFNYFLKRNNDINSAIIEVLGS